MENKKNQFMERLISVAIITSAALGFSIATIAGIKDIKDSKEAPNQIVEILENEAEVKINPADAKAITVKGKITGDGKYYLLSFRYFNKEENKNDVEILYSVDKQTYQFFTQMFDDLSMQRKLKFLKNLTEKYDPISTFGGTPFAYIEENHNF